MTFKTHQRLGLKAEVPKLSSKAQKSVATHYFNFFGVKASGNTTAWNLLPKSVNGRTSLDSGLGKFLGTFPGTFPTKGCSAVNSNGLVD